MVLRGPFLSVLALLPALCSCASLPSEAGPPFLCPVSSYVSVTLPEPLQSPVPAIENTRLVAASAASRLADQEPPDGQAVTLTRSQEETNRVYGYIYDRGTAARIEGATVQPVRAAPGETVTLKLTFMLFTHAKREFAVEEVREVWQGERLLARLSSRGERKGGTYESSTPFLVPGNTPPGPCTVTFTVTTESSRDVWEAPFEVK